MNTKTKLKAFPKLPRDYTGLVRMLPPRPIHDEADFDNLTEVISAMALHESEFSEDQRDYFDLLCQIVTTYEKEHEPWPRKRTGRERLEFLAEEHSLNGADVSRILGGSRNLGAMILRGEREITAAHARALGTHFQLPPGIFIE